MAQQWYVLYSEMEEAGVECLSIGPHEDDHADAFAFSENFTDGIPDEISNKFNMLAAAPLMFDVLHRYPLPSLQGNYEDFYIRARVWMKEVERVMAIATHGSEEPQL